MSGISGRSSATAAAFVSVGSIGLDAGSTGTAMSWLELTTSLGGVGTSGATFGSRLDRGAVTSGASPDSSARSTTGSAAVGVPAALISSFPVVSVSPSSSNAATESASWTGLLVSSVVHIAPTVIPIRRHAAAPTPIANLRRSHGRAPSVASSEDSLGRDVHSRGTDLFTVGSASVVRGGGSPAAASSFSVVSSLRVGRQRDHRLVR